ncbi:MAG: NAD(P)/FAD-dependent oxidoreductase [Terriglobales bacterium]
MNFDYDVIISGGGPGGSSAAICCAQHGLRTLLIERSPFPRHRPGETLHPGVLPLFKELKVWDDILQSHPVWHSGIHVRWGAYDRFTAFGEDNEGPWLGLSIRRAELDRILLERASAAGAHFLQPCTVYEPTLLDNRVGGLRCDAGSISARFIIDATGPKHWMATARKLAICRMSSRLIATYGYCRGDSGRIASPRIEGNWNGWTWLAPLDNGIYAWSRLLFRGANLQVPETIADLDEIPPRAGADVTWRILDRSAGPGYFVVGDAASVIDPASSTGVLKAVMSGMHAARLIIAVQGKKITEDAAMLKYRVWSHAFFHSKTRQLAEAYAKLRSGSSIATVKERLG